MYEKGLEMLSSLTGKTGMFKILVFGDEHEQLSGFFSAFPKQFYSKEWVKEGNEALERVRKIKPDILFIDASISEKIDKIEICRKIKNAPEIKSTCLIILLDDADEETKTECLKLGVEVLLINPIERNKESLVEENQEINSNSIDIIERYEMLASLYKEVQNAKFEWELSVDCIEDVIVLTDQEGNILRCNKKLIKLTGKDFNEILGVNWHNSCKQFGFNDKCTCDVGEDIVHSNGETFHLNLCSVKKQDGINFGKVIYLHNVTKIRQLNDEVKDKNKKLQEAYNKLKAGQSQILQQEKMASIGQLAAGIAHEINNPIGFVTSNLYSLQKYSNKIVEFLNAEAETIDGLSTFTENEIKELINTIEKRRQKLKINFILDDIGNLIKESVDGTNRVKKIVKDLKNFSHVNEEENQTSNINEGIDSTLNIVWNELKYKVTLNKEYGDIPLTKCNPGQLNQVFMNLLVNASHAIIDKGEITIKTWDKEGYIYVSIADTGCGIPEKYINRLFEPFFTTKDVGKGTGLGLSIAFDIIKSHNGEIFVNSELGTGTEFTIKIPIVFKED